MLALFEVDSSSSTSIACSVFDISVLVLSEDTPTLMLSTIALAVVLLTGSGWFLSMDISSMSSSI